MQNMTTMGKHIHEFKASAARCISAGNTAGAVMRGLMKENI
jgi:hypothetical protein